MPSPIIIKKIEEVHDIGRGGNMNGFVIRTELGPAVTILISNDQSCCENWGYVASEDDFEDFIGAELIDVSTVSSDLKVVEVDDVSEGDMMFVNVETSEGMLQFVLYNEHNGYYSHYAQVAVGDRIIEDTYL